jgi:hypothetical protein
MGEVLEFLDGVAKAAELVKPIVTKAKAITNTETLAKAKIRNFLVDISIIKIKKLMSLLGHTSKCVCAHITHLNNCQVLYESMGFIIYCYV